MILAIVRIALPPRTDRTAALALYRRSASKWVANKDLIEKYYIFDEARRAGGGVYLWPNRDTAARWHGTEYRDIIASIYSVEPEIEFVDVVLPVDPRSGRIDQAVSD